MSWREVVVERVVGGMAMVKIGREGGCTYDIIQGN